MKNNFVTEAVLSLALVALTILLVNPFGWMTSTAVMMIQVVVVVILAAFSIFVWKEQARDERELLHRANAGRWSFLAGAIVLVIGVVVQSVTHVPLDPWLISALSAMVLVKLLSMMYQTTKK